MPLIWFLIVLGNLYCALIFERLSSMYKVSVFLSNLPRSHFTI